jgi:hypothetical protein
MSDGEWLSRIGVPALIGAAAGGGKEISLCLRGLFTRVSLIESVVAIQSNMTIAVANLTQRLVGVEVAGGETMPKGASALAMKGPGCSR